ncbi:hypothetical protein WN944_018723 [Citrus x changshan-huyou]|uniref:Uncharacterized protein n=1 Tax=Citrus x changshan-huyou TaxID=2935761 RepID=A0AAP0LVA5_9ROSI
MSSILFLKWSVGTPPFGCQDKRLTLLLQNEAIQGPTLAILRNIRETPCLQEIGITQRECSKQSWELLWTQNSLHFYFLDFFYEISSHQNKPIPRHSTKESCPKDLALIKVKDGYSKEEKKARLDPLSDFLLVAFVLGK